MVRLEKEDFEKILKEFNYPPEVIQSLWENQHPYRGGEIGEIALRKTAREMAFLWNIQLPENLN